MGDERVQGLDIKVSGTGTVRKAATGPVSRGHVVCRRPDGTIRWEADIDPVPLTFGTSDAPPRPEEPAS